LSLSSAAVRLRGNDCEEEAMKYTLLIHQADAPTPPSDEWEHLSKDEQQAVYAAYKAIRRGTFGALDGPAGGSAL
jgi:hypothetical protein